LVHYKLHLLFLSPCYCLLHVLQLLSLAVPLLLTVTALLLCVSTSRCTCCAAHNVMICCIILQLLSLAVPVLLTVITVALPHVLQLLSLGVPGVVLLDWSKTGAFITTAQRPSKGEDGQPAKNIKVKAAAAAREPAAAGPATQAGLDNQQQQQQAGGRAACKEHQGGPSPP
jgi:hypothetical protein